MIRKPAAYRSVLLRRLRAAATIVAEAQRAAAEGRVPAAVAGAVTTAGAGLALQRRRLVATWDDDTLVAARKWCDDFGRATAAALVPLAGDRPTFNVPPPADLPQFEHLSDVVLSPENPAKRPWDKTRESTQKSRRRR